ncbi:RimK family alpha-L-glutamate ligase [Streptomyces sp. NPDC059355]|uniref:ATP-grasp domain-containing protein n=1 Tax=Streptomyces sp. NPDC059355 TaxID=3346811 RepID=UPI00367AA782
MVQPSPIDTGVAPQGEFGALLRAARHAPELHRGGARHGRPPDREPAVGHGLQHVQALQAQLIARHGFYSPAALVSDDDPDEVLGFVDLHRGAVYKSAGGIRSLVTAFEPVRDTSRLERLRWCPVQFQERLAGPDVRVHVVGDRTFAVRVDSTAVDYRYARAQAGVDARLHAHRLDDDIAERRVALAADPGLPFAGVDLELLPDGRIACFEVNPSPGFSWYESETDLPIAAAVADRLLAPVT